MRGAGRQQQGALELAATNARSHGAGGLTLAADSPGCGQFSHLSKVIAIRTFAIKNYRYYSFKHKKRSYF